VPPIEPPPEPLRATVPSQVGSVHFETFGKLISVRCPREYAGMMRQHGGEWDPGARRWLIDRRRLRRAWRGAW